MRRLSKLVAVFLLAGLVAACSSSGKRVILNQKAEQIAPNAVVALEVKPANQSFEAQSAAQTLRQSLSTDLQAERIFDRVVYAEEKADYDLVVTFTTLEEVSTASRVLLGVMAGGDESRADVVLRDRRDNHIVTRFQAEGEGASHPLSSETGIEAAVAEMNSQIVDALR